MASGRIGGIRSRKSGKVGDEVYSVHQNPDGSYSQVVSAYQPNRNDTLTPDLVIQRICMSICMKFMHAIPEILGEAMSPDMPRDLNMQAFVKHNVNRLKYFIAHPEIYRGNIWFYEYGDPYFYPAHILLAGQDEEIFWWTGPSGSGFGERWTMKLNLRSFNPLWTVRTWISYASLHDGMIIVVLGSAAAIDPLYNTLMYTRIRVQFPEDLDVLVTEEIIRSMLIFDDDRGWQLRFEPVEESTATAVVLVLSSDKIPTCQTPSGAGVIGSYPKDGQWIRMSSVFNALMPNYTVPYVQHYLEDVWDSWYTDRL